MVKCFVLTPMLDTPAEAYSTLTETSASFIGISRDDLELFALVPISHAPQGCDVAVRLKSSSMTFADIDDLLSQRDSLLEQLNRSKEALAACTAQLEHFRETGVRDEKYQRRMKKLKQLDEDNKKLRQVLKSQLESSEHLRLETQQTVESLREEFDQLVKELMAYRKQEADSDKKMLRLDRLKR
mmetsp:Transcript_27421/g.49398  ORF Transcript_27421/g.49398 Transcript_27421/m.49398 type:complete len:184 (-) Transcript_27421:1579-2130(-)